ETLPSILDRLTKQVNMRYRIEGKTIVGGPDVPYFNTYKLNFVNMKRETTSAIAVSGQISQGAQGGLTVASGGTSSTSVTSTSKNNFWEVLSENLHSLL